MKRKLLSVLLVTVIMFAAVAPLAVSAGKYYFLWPVPSCHKISAGYDDGRNHNAIDIPASKGSYVIASASGVVSYVNASCPHNYGKSYNCCNSIGRVIRIKHYTTINGQNVSTRYGHLTDIFVREGDYVKAGQVIGTVGSTGYSTGNHLDFKAYMGDTVIDLGPYLEIPSDLSYTGSDWRNNSAYITALRNYNNGEYGGDAQISVSSTSIITGTVISVTYFDVTAPGSGPYIDGAYECPVLVVRGKKFGVSGTVASPTPIKSVTAQIITADGTAKSTKTAEVNAYAYNLANIAPSLHFDRLSAGDYIYAVAATDANGAHTLIYRNFMVSPGDAIIAGSDCSYPVCLKPGESFTLTGTVAGVSELASVTASVVSPDGNHVLASAVAYPLSKTFNLKNIDAAIKFNQLTPGEYRYTVAASDTDGRTVTVLDKHFYVNPKKLVTGEVSISGLGYTGAVSSNLASPYTDHTLTADTDLSVEKATVAYQWYADGAAIAGENSKTLFVSKNYRGKKLSVKVTATGDYFGSCESRQTQPVTSAQDVISDIVEKDYRYEIDVAKQTVGPMLPGTTARQLMDGVMSTDIFTGCYDPLNYLLADDAPLGTGYSLRSMLFGYVVVLKYYCVVLGDINGDARVTAADARTALRKAAGLAELNNMGTAAADVDFDGRVTANDARTILRVAADLGALKMPDGQ